MIQKKVCIFVRDARRKSNKLIHKCYPPTQKTTGYARGAPFGRELVRAGDREIKKKGSDRVADRIQSYWKE
jgi:hypothetical protein